MGEDTALHLATRIFKPLTVKKPGVKGDFRFLSGVALSMCFLSGCYVSGGGGVARGSDSASYSVVLESPHEKLVDVLDQELYVAPSTQALRPKDPKLGADDNTSTLSLVATGGAQNLDEPLSTRIWAFVKMDRAELWRDMNQPMSTHEYDN